MVTGCQNPGHSYPQQFAVLKELRDALRDAGALAAAQDYWARRYEQLKIAEAEHWRSIKRGFGEDVLYV